MTKINYQLYIFLLFVLLVYNAGAQTTTNKTLVFQYKNNQPKFKIKTPLLTDTSFSNFTNQLKHQFYDNGYLGFSIDSIANNPDTLVLFMLCGKQYQVKAININHDDFNYLNQKFLFKRKLNPKNIDNFDKTTLEKIINNGYPYAILNKQINNEHNAATINYYIKQGPKVTFDSISTIPENLINYKYLANKTGIKYGDSYNKKAVLQIKKNLTQTKLFEIDTVYNQITGNKAINIVKLKPIKQNLFTALIGLQNSNNNKAEFNGNATLHLTNTLKAGETFFINWAKPSTLSQLLETHFKLPYLFNFPLGSELYFTIDKNDSTYTNTDIKAGLNFTSLYTGEFSLYTKYKTSTVNNTNAENYNSSATNQYGFGYNYMQYDNPFIPKKGLMANIQVFIGTHRQTTPNSSYNKQPILEMLGLINIAFPMPIGSFYIENNASILLADSLKNNNLYRLGGVNSIRGFNERSIFAKQYAITKAEYRIYIGNESFLFVLNDFGYFNSPDNNSFSSIYKQAVGAGLNIKTNAGILTISYALGRNLNSPFKLNEGKIHIGYLNMF